MESVPFDIRTWLFQLVQPRARDLGADDWFLLGDFT